jgi:hypothetical protein
MVGERKGKREVRSVCICDQGGGGGAHHISAADASNIQAEVPPPPKAPFPYRAAVQGQRRHTFKVEGLISADELRIQTVGLAN